MILLSGFTVQMRYSKPRASGDDPGDIILTHLSLW